MCQSAAIRAEREASLPEGLLLAIGRVETGRVDAVTGRAEPWPWSTNAAGSGHYFGSAAEAIAWTDAQFGVSGLNIDVGCFQINLRAHPLAFDTLEQAFDPLANARYAARYLNVLYAQSGSWQDATARYHSADPARGLPYRDQVFAQFQGRQAPLSLASATMSAVLMDGSKPLSKLRGVEVIVPSWSASQSSQWGVPANQQWGVSAQAQWGLTAQPVRPALAGVTGAVWNSPRPHRVSIGHTLQVRPVRGTRMPIVFTPE